LRKIQSKVNVFENIKSGKFHNRPNVAVSAWRCFRTWCPSLCNR